MSLKSRLKEIGNSKTKKTKAIYIRVPIELKKEIRAELKSLKVSYADLFLEAYRQLKETK